MIYEYQHIYIWHTLQAVAGKRLHHTQAYMVVATVDEDTVALRRAARPLSPSGRQALRLVGHGLRRAHCDAE